MSQSVSLANIHLPRLQFEAQLVPNFGGTRPDAYRTGWFYPFWYNDDGGFKEHQQINWTNLYLIKRFGLPDGQGKFVIPDDDSSGSSSIDGSFEELKKLIPQISGNKGSLGLKGLLGERSFSCKGHIENLTCYSPNATESHLYHVEGSSINHQLNTVQDQCAFIYKGLAVLQNCIGNGENVPDSISQDDLDRQTREIRNIVERARQKIEDQNAEILDKLREYGRIIRDLDEVKSEDIKKALRDTQGDIDVSISKLESLERATLEAVLKLRPGEGKDLASKLDLISHDIEQLKSQERTCCENIKYQLTTVATKDDLKNLKRKICLVLKPFLGDHQIDLDTIVSS